MWAPLWFKLPSKRRLTISHPKYKKINYFTFLRFLTFRSLSFCCARTRAKNLCDTGTGLNPKIPSNWKKYSRGSSRILFWDFLKKSPKDFFRFFKGFVYKFPRNSFMDSYKKSFYGSFANFLKEFFGTSTSYSFNIYHMYNLGNLSRIIPWISPEIL